MENVREIHSMKPLEEMNVIDDFLFTEIMADEDSGLEACRIILSCVLKRKIENLCFTAQKVVPGISEKSHGIRLDAYVTENKGDNADDISVYDVEPEKRVQKKAGLPKRSRYYADLIDVQLLEKGTEYEELPELVTIFILSYDPFGDNAMYYEAGTTLKTHSHLQYNDGIRRIFLYVGGDLPKDAGEDEKKIQNLLRYISESKEENATDESTQRLDGIVRSTKAKKDVNKRYMKSWERERELIEEGRDKERVNTEREKRRADEATRRADEAEKRIAELEAQLAVPLNESPEKNTTDAGRRITEETAKLTKYLMEQKSSISKEDAETLARSILK